VDQVELAGDDGPAVRLSVRLMPQGVGDGAFRVGFEGLEMDAASVVIASEDGRKSGDLMMVFCGR
jgi:hypothetical protein